MSKNFVNTSKRYLEVTAIAPCPNRCTYCPQELLAKNYKGVTLLVPDVFEKIVSNVGKGVIIHFSGRGDLYNNPFHKELINKVEGYEYKIFSSINPDADVYNPINSVKDPIIRACQVEEVKEEDVYCSAGRHHPVVMPNGDLYLCCMDYNLDHRLGDLLNQKYEDIDIKDNYRLCKSCSLSRSIK